MVTRRGRRVQLGTASASEALLRLYCVDLDEERVWEVMTAMALHDKVFMAQRPEDADAVLTLRARVKANTALRASAKAAGVPVYAIKSPSTSNLIKAFRTLLGVEPAAGGFFPARASAAAAAAGGSPPGAAAPGGRGSLLFSSLDGGGESSVDDGDGAGGDAGEAGEDADDADAGLLDVWPGGNAGGAPAGPAASSSYRSTEEREGLEEAQLAVEQIVLPLKQPVELLPRSEGVRDAQAAMVGRYKLGVEVVGAGDDARLRILPAAAAVAE
jgi:hypothetical protein